MQGRTEPNGRPRDRKAILLAILLSLALLAVGILYWQGRKTGMALSEREEEVAELKRQMSAGQATIQEFGQRLKGCEEKAHVLGTTVTETEDRYHQLQRNVADLQKEKGRKESAEQLQSAHEALVAEFKKELGDREVCINKLENKLRVEFLDHILFNFGSSRITPRGLKVLEKTGEVLQRLDNKKLIVVGHSDDVPIARDYRYKYRSNWELSAARAAAVVRYFQKHVGIDPADMEAVGKAFYQPAANNSTEEGRALNRRVEIIIAVKGDERAVLLR